MLKMFVKMEGTIGDYPSLREFKESENGLGFGGYCFQIPINGKEIDVPFDFPGFVANIQDDGTLLLEAGEDTPFSSGDNSQLEDCWDDEYKELGISRENLTAKVLSSVTKIKEFAVDCDEKVALKILSIEFFEDGTVYPVDQEVIKNFSITGDDRMYYQWKANQLKDEMVGYRYCHFKGNVYVVTNLAVQSESEGILVIYKDFMHPDKVWARPLDMFLSEVDHVKYPDVAQKMRFEKITK